MKSGIAIDYVYSEEARKRIIANDLSKRIVEGPEDSIINRIGLADAAIRGLDRKIPWYCDLSRQKVE